MDDGPADTQEPLTADIDPAAPAEAEAAEAPAREPLALQTALVWLATVRPAAALALLREPEFALVSMTGFAGFRVNATGYANPLVRRRLAQEAVRDAKFADKLQALAETPSVPASAAPSPEGREMGQEAASAPHAAEGVDSEAERGTEGPSVPPPGGQAAKPHKEESESRLAALKSERDRRRRERDEARLALADAEAARQEAERRRQQAETERDEASQLAQRQAQRVARLERQVGRLQTEQAGLLRALRQRETVRESGPTAGPQEALSAGAGKAIGTNPWQAAVAHLLDKRRYDLALLLAEDVLRADPDNPDALDIAAQGQGARGDTRGAAALLRRRLAVALTQGARGEAGEVLLRLLLLAPAEPERDLRAFLSGLRADDTPAVDLARTMLARLRGLAPETHAAAADAIMRLAPAPLAEALMPPPGRIGPDDPLPLGLGGNISARQLLRAVDTGHVDLVEGARVALARLHHTDPAGEERVRQALERAAGDDVSALVPLLGTSGRGPAVVDGSNVAWFDQESLAAGRPRLRPLLGLRRSLRARGYFPVLLYGDAPLPYTIDEPDSLRAMVAQGEMSLVDGGVDADEVLLREAKRFRAPLITNDYMADWDPNNEVRKIRFTLSFNGDAYLLEP